MTDSKVDETTTIRIDKKIRDRLAVLGNKTDTYNDIIERLLKKCGPERK